MVRYPEARGGRATIEVPDVICTELILEDSPIQNDKNRKYGWELIVLDRPIKRMYLIDSKAHWRLLFLSMDYNPLMRSRFPLDQ